MSIYALSEPGARLVKIGHAKDVRARVRSLMLGCPVPLELRAHWRGNLDDEARLHLVFGARRQHGEWFDFGADDPIALITTQLGRCPLATLTATEFAARRPHQRRILTSPGDEVWRREENGGAYWFAGMLIRP